jgi:hypothetical protein
MIRFTIAAMAVTVSASIATVQAFPATFAPEPLTTSQIELAIVRAMAGGF